MIANPLLHALIGKRSSFLLFLRSHVICIYIAFRPCVYVHNVVCSSRSIPSWAWPQLGHRDVDVEEYPHLINVVFGCVKLSSEVCFIGNKNLKIPKWRARHYKGILWSFPNWSLYEISHLSCSVVSHRTNRILSWHHICQPDLVKLQLN